MCLRTIQQESTVRGQELANAVKDADFTRAIQLAFELRRPHQLFDLFSQLYARSSEDSLQKALSAFSKDELRVLLEYIREWNTKPKLCHVAQYVLSWVCKIFPPTDIMEIKSISELLKGLMPYSQRHFSRVGRLGRSTFLLDYVLVGMSVLDPDSGALSSKPQPMLSSDNNSAATSIGYLNSISTNNDKMEEKASSKKRKSSKSKRGIEKKVKKLESHEEDGSVISVGA